MILFFESGRLGNQLLQYAVLRSLFPDHRLVFFGLGALRRGFACERTVFVWPDRAAALPARVLRRLLAAMAALRLIGDAREQRRDGRCTLERRAGLLRSIVLVRPAFFQHADYERCIPPTLALQPALLADARRFVDGQLAGTGDVPVFVHMRRGDYVDFPSREAAAALPAEWVLGAMQHLRSAIARPRFFVCSDDLAHAREVLGRCDDVVFCDRGELGDLAVMASCSGGVLSPSTFSWWGAQFARRTLTAAGRQGLFVAPEFWVGHRAGQWYPPGFVFPWLHYLRGRA
jgi:hypothetical protein